MGIWQFAARFDNWVLDHSILTFMNIRDKLYPSYSINRPLPWHGLDIMLYIRGSPPWMAEFCWLLLKDEYLFKITNTLGWALELALSAMKWSAFGPNIQQLYLYVLCWICLWRAFHFISWTNSSRCGGDFPNRQCQELNYNHYLMIGSKWLSGATSLLPKTT